MLTACCAQAAAGPRLGENISDFPPALEVKRRVARPENLRVRQPDAPEYFTFVGACIAAPATVKAERELSR